MCVCRCVSFTFLSSRQRSFETEGRKAFLEFVSFNSLVWRFTHPDPSCFLFFFLVFFFLSLSFLICILIDHYVGARLGCGFSFGRRLFCFGRLIAISTDWNTISGQPEYETAASAATADHAATAIQRLVADQQHGSLLNKKKDNALTIGFPLP